MRDHLGQLLRHKGYVDGALLNIIRQNGGAAADPEIRELLEHMLVANRFWLLTIIGSPFVLDEEARRSASLDALIARYRATHAQELAWLETDDDSARVVEHPDIPNGQCAVWEGVMQVCLHSQGHRSQCATLLRRHGGVPPSMDFIAWVANGRPAADWHDRGE